MNFERKSIKPLVFAVMIAVGLLFSGSFRSAEASDVVGVVDVLKAFRQTDLGKSIQSHLKEFEKKKRKGSRPNGTSCRRNKKGFSSRWV